MNKSRKHRLQSVLETFFAALIVIILMLPFYIMFMMGTYSTAEIFRILPFKPGSHLLENLKNVANDGSFPMFRGIINSICI